MRYPIIKWFGTALIIFVGVFYAVNVTYKWKVSESRVYNLQLPEYAFTLKDGRQVNMAISFMFMDKQSADHVSVQKLELINFLNGFFRTIDSTNFDTVDHIEYIKALMLSSLKSSNYPVQQIYFEAKPRLL